MKKLILLSFAILAISIVCQSSVNNFKPPIKIEVITKYTSIEEALKVAKEALLQQKFIVTNSV